MKKITYMIFTIIIIIVALSPKSFNQSENQFSELESTLLVATGEIVKLFRKEHYVIWPGFDLSKQPFAVYIPGKWILLVNTNKKINGFIDYPKDWPKLYTDAIIHFGSYKDLTGQLQFDYDFDSIRTVVVGFPEDYYANIDEEAKINIFGFIIHEAFHQYQHNSFGQISWSREEKYSILNVNNTASAFLEMLLLEGALKAMAGNNRSECKKLLLSFSQIRKNRWESEEEFIRIYEQGQEINEGTAKYVEVKSILEMNKKSRKENPGIDSSYLKAFEINGISYLLNEFTNKMDDKTISPEDMIRNRIYPIGAAQGILMDYLDIDWKSRAQEAGGIYTFIQSVLEKYGENTTTNVSSIKREYDFDGILRATKKKIEQYIQGFDREMHLFESQQGTRIEICFDYSSLSRSGSSRSKKWVMDSGGKTLCMNYRLLKFKTKQVKIDLENIAVLQLNDWDKKWMKIIFYSFEIPPIVIDSIKYKPSEEQEMQFSSLMFSGQGFDVVSGRKGYINFSKKRVLINFENK